MNACDRLLAKGQRLGEPWRDSMLLHFHLADVHRSAAQVLDSTGAQQLTALGLDPGTHSDRFRRIVLLAAVLHDVGKANDHFQGMLRGQCTLQALRHEWVSVLIASRQAWRQWLRPAVLDDTDLDIALWAIAGHHPAYGRASPPERAAEGAGSRMVLLMEHRDFGKCLREISSALGLADPPARAQETIPLAGMTSVFTDLRRQFLRSRQLWDTLPDELKRLTAAAKVCLLAGDVAGSALPRAGKEIIWISDAFGNLPTSLELRQIVDDRLEGASLRPFQRSVANSTNRVTFVRAGCGSGKTLAAYAWAAEQAPSRRLYFCYPTTGTSTEGFRDYVFDAQARLGKHGARLFHGRADVDLEVILDASDEDADDSEARLRSLHAWKTPIVSCTVDTVLGLVQNNRRGLYAWPALVGSAFIFDEIHAYDERLFGALLRFLHAMRGVKVLLMTASLPTSRLDALRASLARAGETLMEVGGPESLELLKRYRRVHAIDPSDPLLEVAAAVRDRQARVLWVCNTVDRAMKAAERASAAGLAPLLYHSRFRYIDRVHRHKEVIEVFRCDQPALAVCTQVAEMSLDLSASMLVTDLAPVPPMIQRLGRLNRRAVPPHGNEPAPPTMPFVVVEPSAPNGSSMPLPYSDDELARARQWLADMGDVDLSQRDLADCWLALDNGDVALPIGSAWLDGGPQTQVLELRTASPGLTVFLTQDLGALEDGSADPMEVALPMPQPPKNLNWREWKTFKGIPIAPEGIISYDPLGGGRWRK